MSISLSRRDFLKISSISLSGAAFSPFIPDLTGFDDSEVIRIATEEMPVYRQPSDKEGTPIARWLRDELVIDNMDSGICKSRNR